MCGRYFLARSKADQPSDELSRIIAALNRKKTPASLKTSGEIFPSDIVPVLANNRQMNIEPFAMRWGYSFPNSRPIINARCETASQKALFKDGMLQRRCLIPASNYFEWGWSDSNPKVEDDASVDDNSHEDTQKSIGLRQNANNRQRIKYAIWPKESYTKIYDSNGSCHGNQSVPSSSQGSQASCLSNGQSSLFYFAGIYHLENHGGTLIPCFTILTQSASANIAFIHDRMPVILPHDFLVVWLNPKVNAEDIIKNAEKMMEYRAV